MQGIDGDEDVNLIILLAIPESEADSKHEDTYVPMVVCVTACPSGVAHTCMAAEYLEKAGKKLGMTVCVEKQGTNGIEDKLTSDQNNDAAACAFASEVAIIEAERFNGIPKVEVTVAAPIRNAEEILNEALEGVKKGTRKERGSHVNNEPKTVGIATELKQAPLSGDSFSVPLIISGAIVLAVMVMILL